VRGSARVRRLAFIAPDPSDDDSPNDPGGIEPRRAVVTSLLFLSGVATCPGPSSPVITRARQREPQIPELMRTAGNAALRQTPLRDAHTPGVARIEAAARHQTAILNLSLA
jgi:hypothetical protein